MSVNQPAQSSPDVPDNRPREAWNTAIALGLKEWKWLQPNYNLSSLEGKIVVDGKEIALTIAPAGNIKDITLPDGRVFRTSLGSYTIFEGPSAAFQPRNMLELIYDERGMIINLRHFQLPSGA